MTRLKPYLRFLYRRTRSVQLKPVNMKRSSAPGPVRWEHLPHDALTLEINSRIADREAHRTDLEVAKNYLGERLKRLKVPEHNDYVNCVAADLKRELRICRDVYRDYLKTINKKSATAKARVALDFAVAPRASKRLREEVLIYVRSVGVDDLMFAVLFYRLADRLLTYADIDSEWLELGTIVSFLVPDSCFQELKEVTSREITRLTAGPFGDPVQPFDRLVFDWKMGVGKSIPNAIWDHRNMLLGCELWRLWDLVFHEICDQHAAIDLAEHSNIALALIALSPFESLAGKMFYEAMETDGTRVPDDVFIGMGRALDENHISLADNLDANGREILRHLGRKGRSMKSWELALADKGVRSFLPESAATRVEAVTLKGFGTLNRSVKRAFYRAKDAYQRALERVYEERVPAAIKKNPFESRL